MTAEFAIGLPGVIAVLLLALGVFVAGAAQIECQEAARVGVREAMLTGSSQEASNAARLVAGERAVVTVDREGRWITVGVSRPLFIDGFPIRISAKLSAPIEGEGGT